MLHWYDFLLRFSVVSGVGFLGAGVIISDGARLRGINTGATLWCAAAVGALAASGFVWQAGVATASVLGINILLRPVGAPMYVESGYRSFRYFLHGPFCARWKAGSCGIGLVTGNWR